MTTQRYALIITCSEYLDPKLSPLPSAVQDATDLERILSNPALGNFQVTVLSNKAHHEIISAIEEFTADRNPGDLLLIHFSGHGLKDSDGRLYFAAHNTRTSRLYGSAIPAATVNDLLTNRSRAQRKVLILDCCYGGAFLRGVLPRSEKEIGARVGALEPFQEGRGLIVLTASDALQYAYEGNEVKGKVSSSVFTSILVEGIETGKADKDGDGRIGVSELYDYIYERISEVRPEQRPEITTFRVQGDIFIARSRNLTARVNLTWEEAQAGGSRQVRVGEREEIIPIPPGVTDGHEDKYVGKGLPGEAGNPPGDLIIIYKVAPRPTWWALHAKATALAVGLIIVVFGLTILIVMMRKPIAVNNGNQTSPPQATASPNVNSGQGSRPPIWAHNLSAKRFSQNSDGQATGFDVSQYLQFDWNWVVKNPVSFVIIRATFGSSRKDDYFDEKWRELKTEGIIRGTYHVFKHNEDGKRQAEFYLETAHLESDDLPPILDIEDALPNQGVDDATLVKRVQDWLDFVKNKTQRTPIIYTYKAFWDAHMTDKFGGYPLYISSQRPPSKANLPKGWNDWLLWQNPVISQEASTVNSKNSTFNGSYEQLQDFIWSSTKH